MKLFYFQTRYFAQKVFRPIQNNQQQKVSLLKKVERYPDSQMIKINLQQQVLIYGNQLKDEPQINTKIRLLSEFTDQLRLLNQDQLDQDVLMIFQKNEPIIFDYFNSQQATKNDIDWIIFSLYMDPRFISKNVNSGRLTKLVTSLLPVHFDCDKITKQSIHTNQNAISEIEGTKLSQILQILLNSGVKEHKEVARQIYQKKMKKSFSLDTQTLLKDIQSVQPYMTYEFTLLDDRYRYKSDKQQVDSEYILPHVIKQIENRLAENKITRDQFIQILRINNDAHKNGLHNFRLIRHFEPQVLDFIEKAFFADQSSHQLLWRIAFSYAINNHEQDMRIVYYKFLHTLFDKIAHDSVLKNQEHTDISTLKNIVRSIGSTQITSPSILKILKQFNKNLLIDLSPTKFAKSISTAECITSFIDTCVNLRCIDQFDFATEILPLLNFMSNQFIASKNQLIVAQFLKLLKSLAKGQIYLHQDKMLDIWQQFLQSNISELVQQENFKLNSVGDYAYVAQVLFSDMKIKIDMPDDLQLHLINKLKIPAKTEYNLHNQMKRFLTHQLGEKFETEVRVGVLSVDLVLPKYKIAIELEGPSHFIIKENGDLMLTGTTLAKHRVLAQCGQFDRVFQTVGNLAQAEVNNIEDVMEQIQEFIETKK